MNILTLIENWCRLTAWPHWDHEADTPLKAMLPRALSEIGHIAFLGYWDSKLQKDCSWLTLDQEGCMTLSLTPSRLKVEWSSHLSHLQASLTLMSPAGLSVRRGKQHLTPFDSNLSARKVRKVTCLGSSFHAALVFDPEEQKRLVVFDKTVVFWFGINLDFKMKKANS